MSPGMKKILITLLPTVMLMGCLGYMPGLQSYWDAQVREMCEKDGGVKIFEHIIVSPEQAVLLPKVGGYYGVVPEELSKPQEPAFVRFRRFVIRDGNPTVSRIQQDIIRRSDGRIVGQVVSYGRGGGDFPSYAHPSSFGCPDYLSIYKGIHGVYRVEGVAK